MADGMNLTLDLLGYAGQAKTVMTGKTSKYTKLSGVLRGVGDTVKAYNDNRNTLQAQRDIALGQVNQGLKEQSEVYNATVLFNDLEEGGRAIMGSIDDGEFDDMDPVTFSDMMAEREAEVMEGAVTSDLATGMVTRWMYDNQTKFQNVHADRYRKKAYTKMIRETEIAGHNLLLSEDPNRPHNYKTFTDSLIGIKDANMKDQILGKVSLTLALQGNTKGMDILMDAPKTAVNAEILKQSRKHYQNFVAGQYNGNWARDLMSMDTQAENGGFNILAGEQLRLTYPDRYTPAQWTQQYRAWAKTSKISNAKSQVDYGNMDRYGNGWSKGTFLHQYGTKGKQLAQDKYVSKIMQSTTSNPAKRQEAIMRDVMHNNPGTTAWVGYFENALLDQGVAQDGAINPGSLEALKTATMMIQNANSASATAALGKSAPMVHDIQIILAGNGNDLEAAMQSYFLQERNPFKMSTETEEDIATLSEIQTRKIGQNKGFENKWYQFGEEANMDQVSDYMSKRITQLMRGGTFKNVKAAAQFVGDEMQNRVLSIDGRPYIQTQPGELEDRYGVAPDTIVQYFKTSPDAMAMLLPDTDIPAERLGTMTWTIGDDRGSFLLTDQETNTQITMPISMARDLYHTQDAIRQNNLHSLAEGIANDATIAREQVLDSQASLIDMAMLDAKDMDPLQAVQLQYDLKRIRPEWTAEDFSNASKRERWQIVKEMNNNTYIEVHVAARKFMNAIKKKIASPEFAARRAPASIQNK